MRSFFRSFDINGDGYLSKMELKEALIKMRAPMSEDIIDLMFAGVDANRDGTISYTGKSTETSEGYFCLIHSKCSNYCFLHVQ